MDYRDLVFLTVAHNLNISKAAEELHISQPAVSNHVKELENKLGVALLERRGNRIALTKAGEILVTHLRLIKQQYLELEFDISNSTGGAKGSLNLGASSTIAQYLLPQVLGAFHKRYPGIKIVMLNGNSHEIESMLIDRVIDIAMVENESSDSSIKYKSAMRDKIIAVAGSQSVYSIGGEFNYLSLKEIPLILRERGSGTLEVMEKALNSIGIGIDSLNVYMNLGTTEAIKRMLFDFDGIAFVSEWAVKSEIEENKLKQLNIRGLEIVREFRWAQRKGPNMKIPTIFQNFFEVFFK